MNVKVYQGIDTVPQKLWDEMVSDHPFSRWAWCKFHEALSQPDSIYYLIVTVDGDHPIGGAQFSINPEEVIPTSNVIARRIIEAYIKKHPFITSSAGPVLGFNGLYFPDDTSLHPEFIQHVMKTGQDIAQEYAGSFLIFSYLENSLNDKQGWDDTINLNDYMDASTRLLIKWETYEQYLQHLSKKRRKNIRRNTEAAAKLGIRIECNSEVSDIDRAEHLTRTVHQKYGIQGKVIIRPILENAHLIPDYIWLTAHHEDQLVGCEILVYDKYSGVAAPLVYGRNYAVDQVYFAMYYREIQFAIEQFKSEILIGNSDAYDAKRRMGFELEKRNNIRFQPISPLSRLMFTLFKGVV